MLFNTSLKCYTFTKATFSLIRISFTESTSGIQPSNLDLLSKCPRIPITLVGKDGEQKQPRSRSPKKNLILISLLQDYRHGIEHSNNMPVQFGFSLFRVYFFTSVPSIYRTHNVAWWACSPTPPHFFSQQTFFLLKCKLRIKL